MLYHMQPKKAFKVLSTIRSGSNNLSNVHAVVVWIISSMKELLHLPNQLLPVAIHQTVSTHPHILSGKDISTTKDIYAMFFLDVTYHASEVQ